MLLVGRLKKNGKMSISGENQFIMDLLRSIDYGM
jgi:hypothetical protein